MGECDKADGEHCHERKVRHGRTILLYRPKRTKKALSYGVFYRVFNTKFSCEIPCQNFQNMAYLSHKQPYPSFGSSHTIRAAPGAVNRHFKRAVDSENH